MNASDEEKGRNSPRQPWESTRNEREPRPSTSSRDSDAAPDAPGRDSKDDEIWQPPDSPEKPAETADEPSTQDETDPFEVGWDGGDDDPLCPRSTSLGRKWLMVFITSLGSLCV